MRVEVLVCKPDGTQVLEIRELPDNRFELSEAEEEKTKE